jgi:phenylacetate-CoA ligase
MNPSLQARLQAVIKIAAQRSPFYGALYREVLEQNAGSEIALESLPIIDQTDFWKANTLTHNRLLTGPMNDGVVYKSGGTTGSPKFSVFTRDEWQEFTAAFGWGLNQGGLRRGERVGNLFYAGELYASFLFVTASLAAAPEPALLLPISGATKLEEMTKLLAELEATTLTGAPTTILSLAAYLEQHGKTLPSVRKILFGGESAYAEQRAYLRRVFNQAEVRSVGYASVDAGLLGYADVECEPGEHRCFDGHSIIELVDESTEDVVHEMDVPGRILVTNVRRTLMPILRYPAGDRAVWKEPVGTPNRKFQLLGRAEEGARVGPATLYFEDLMELLQGLSSDRGGHALSVQNLQLVIEHEALKDRLIMRVAVSDPEASEAQTAAIVAEVLAKRPMIAELVQKGFIHEPRVQFVFTHELETNPRTGKVKRVIDRR